MPTCRYSVQVRYHRHLQSGHPRSPQAVEKIIRQYAHSQFVTPKPTVHMDLRVIVWGKGEQSRLQKLLSTYQIVLVCETLPLGLSSIQCHHKITSQTPRNPINSSLNLHNDYKRDSQCSHLKLSKCSFFSLHCDDYSSHQ
jgi:ribosomal protein L31E